MPSLLPRVRTALLAIAVLLALVFLAAFNTGCTPAEAAGPRGVTATGGATQFDLSAMTLTDGDSLISSTAAKSVSLVDQSATATLGTYYLGTEALADGTYVLQVERTSGELSDADRAGLLIGICDSAAPTTRALIAGPMFTAADRQVLYGTSNAVSDSTDSDIVGAKLTVEVGNSVMSTPGVVALDGSGTPTRTAFGTEHTVTGEARTCAFVRRATSDGTTTWTASTLQYTQID